MGLDMYLYLKKYESVMPYDKDVATKSKGFYPQEFEGFVKRQLETNFLSKETLCQVGYWRKANAIHQWFVEKCADNRDDCTPIHVEVDKAKELLDLVEKTLANKDKAKDNLPTQSGFFFGSTEYDEGYFSDLEYTRDLLKDVLNFMKDKDWHWSIVYHASW